MKQQKSIDSLKPFTRRRFLTTATASVGVLALSACGGGGEAEATSAALGDEGIKTALARKGRNWKSDTTPPSTPSGVMATPVSSSSITLTWGASTDDTGVTRYRVYRITGIGQRETSTTIASPTSTSYTDIGLNSGTTYGYKVVALDAAGNISDLSSMATATTLSVAVDSIAPSVPTGLTLTATSSSSVSVTWSPSTDNVGVSGYRLYRCSGGSCTSVAQIAAPTGTSYVDSGLTAGTSYSYCVAAVDAAGNVSALSPLAVVSTLPTTSVTWKVDPSPVLVAGSATGFDLAQTLPPGVIQGGTFALDPSSTPLPSGVTLSSSGILKASSSASGSFNGVVFSYREPGT